MGNTFQLQYGTLLPNSSQKIEHHHQLQKDNMVTFTLTPTNANEIPHNAIHLIVAEGATYIPVYLCHREEK